MKNNGNGKTEKRGGPDIIDVGTTLLPAVQQDSAVVEEAGRLVTQALSRLPAFFRTASALEQEAADFAAQVKAMTRPKTMAEDEQLQLHIKQNSAQIKAVEEHWSITKAVTSLRNRMSAGRARPVEIRTAVDKVMNQWHNEYVAEAARLERIEQDRLRREAEEKAARDRQAELDALEAQAAKAEEATADLSPREESFTLQVAAGLSEQRAAELAGFSNPLKSAARLMALPKIIAAIAAQRTANAIRDQKAAVAAQPVFADVPEAASRVSTVHGHSRGTHSAVVIDAAKFLEAAVSGKHGIPASCVSVSQAGLNDQARAHGAGINKWPGVEYKFNSRLV